jgi:hypothetical protein
MLHIPRDKAPKPAPKAPDKTVPTTPAAALTDAVKAQAAGQDGGADAKPVNQELARAQDDARGKEEEAREASAEAQSITARIDNLKKNIELGKKLLESARPGRGPQGRPAAGVSDQGGGKGPRGGTQEAGRQRPVGAEGQRRRPRRVAHHQRPPHRVTG